MQKLERLGGFFRADGGCDGPGEQAIDRARQVAARFGQGAPRVRDAEQGGQRNL